MINIYPDLLAPNKQGLSAIVIRFDFDRKHIGTDNLHQKVNPEFWEKGKVKSRFPNHELINSIIENSLNRHKQFILRRQAFGLPLSKEVLKQYLKSNTAYENFYQYAQTVIEEKKLKDGKEYSPDTKRRYRDEIKRMMQFKPHLHFKDITVSFLTSYRLWMQNDYKKKDKSKLNKNSIWKALGFIRMVYNEAIAEQIILPEGNPFRQFKVGSYEVDESKIKFLELPQIEKIEEILLTEDLPELTEKVGWRFLCMCVSGMRISDAMLLDQYMFNDAGDLEFKPHKTIRHDNTAHIPITTERQRRYFQRSLNDCFEISNAKNFRSTFNIQLKILAAKAGVKINLTSHVGRHTMGSFLVDGGVEEKAAMTILGVKSNKVIKTYLHLKQSKLKSEASKLTNVF